MTKNSTRYFSTIQEESIAKLIDGKTTANSGGTKFGGGDVLTEHLLIEAKTPTSEKSSFSIKEEWIMKSKEQAFEQGKKENIVAFCFKPHGENYFILNEKQFKFYNEKIKEIYKNV